jgi:glycosyltransferase involved in cell wall biosynthesis
MRSVSIRCPTISELPSPVLSKIGWPWTEGSLQFPETISDGLPWPRISIVTPSYNQGQFIEETIRSVLLQGYPNLEFIIIDGGSMDKTIEVIKKYEPWLASWVSEPDRGQSHAINKGIQRATGDILFWLNSDDLCLPDAFRSVAEAFQAHPGVALVTGQARQVDQQGKIIGELRSYFTSWDEVVTNPRNSVRQISTFFSRTLFKEVGLIDENLHDAMDHEFMIRITRFHVPLILNNYLIAYRTHINANSFQRIVECNEESERMRSKFFYNKKIAAIYHKRSVTNWICLSEMDRLTPSKRIICILHAVKNRPSTIFSREFWWSMKNIWISLYDSTTRKGKEISNI